MEWAGKLLGSTLKPSDGVLREAAKRLRESANQMTFPEADPAHSDMIAGEYQAAIEEAWVWNPFPGVPPTREEAYRRLLARKEILDHVNKARENRKQPPIVLP